ncbi:MAG: Holliday junction branch migration protein RuvA [Clostridia bacterium]|nr:Holliday junction branch migration protein RuvA [Clostridia bacterium]
MIYSLNGILSNLEDDFFVVKCAGIGFKCKSDLKTLSHLKNSLGEEINVFTILNIRENAWDLFGFNDKIHVECFKMLTSVTGVGPKIALAIFSEFLPDEIFSMILMNNVNNFTMASGVGEKMAKRIVLELKEKIKKLPFSEQISEQKGDNNKSKAISALEVLGYSAKEVAPVLEKLDGSAPTEELIKQALKNMGGQRG